MLLDSGDSNATGMLISRRPLSKRLPKAMARPLEARTTAVLKSGVIATFGSGDEEEYYTDGPTLEPPDGS